jgi:tetratricopeptide (TPR) repeat protein
MAWTPALADPPPAPPPAAGISSFASAAGVIDFTSEPGAAAFRRGDQAVLVFDTPEVPDLTDLRASPAFATATLLSLPDSQVITFPLPPAYALALTPVSAGWRIAVVRPPARLPPAPLGGTSLLSFSMQSANQSVIIADPTSGTDLLIGTVRQADDAADYAESGPGFAVLPAWLGVVVVPQADNLNLNASLQGFELVSDAPEGLPLGAPPQVQPALSPSPSGPAEPLRLPQGTTVELRQRLLTDQHAVAVLPALGRLSGQLALARDMLALGMGPETVAVLDTAIRENPAAGDNGDIARMRAIAVVISHRSQPDEFRAAGIVPDAELAFWQALAQLDDGQAAKAVPALIAGLGQFESYPESLRHTMDAQLAEALVENGQMRAAQQLCASDPNNPGLDLARADILEKTGQSQAALMAYQALVRGPDVRMAALAHARVIELQLAMGRLTTAQAADALDAQLFEWRDKRHERHLRLRIAALRAASRQWPQAFTMLQSARALFSRHRPEIDRLRSEMFMTMLSGNGLASLSPIDALAVLQQNQDLIAQQNGNAQLIALLAERLKALDLPGAAVPMLTQLIRALPSGPSRASLGATLAQVDLDAGSPVAALADLAQTQADYLPPDLAAHRAILTAKAQADAGNAIAAVSALAPSPPPAANQLPMPVDPQTLAMQASIAEQSGQWAAAEQALTQIVNQSVPASGVLTPSQESLLLRLATAAAHNNDTATLNTLDAQYATRVENDPAGQMFAALVTPPLSGDQGLAQALHEISRLEALPAMVDAVVGMPPAEPPAKPAPAMR